MGGGGDDFENNPISWQGGTRISSPSQYPVSNIEWTKLKKKEKKKERGEKGKVTEAGVAGLAVSRGVYLVQVVDEIRRRRGRAQGV